MRADIHPDYDTCQVTCSCGNTFETRSTKTELHVELCSNCHPFFTGQQKFVDTGGRVQRFSDKFGGAAEDVMAKTIAAKKARQQAHEDALSAAREAKAAKDAARAEREAKAAKAKPKEEPVAEAVVETEAADEPAIETADVAEATEVVEEAPAEAPAEEAAPEEAAPEAEAVPEESAE